MVATPLSMPIRACRERFGYGLIGLHLGGQGGCLPNATRRLVQGTLSESPCSRVRSARLEPGHGCPRIIRLLAPASYQPKFTDLGPWRNWGADRTKTNGKSRLNTCDPDCGAGDFKRVRVKVVLSRLRASCGGHRAYHRLTFKARKPSIQDGSLDFDCRGELTYG